MALLRIRIARSATVGPFLALLTFAGASLLSGQEPSPPPDPDQPAVTHDLPGPKHRDVLIPAGTASGLPRVVPNDNRLAAGRVQDGVRIVQLEVRRADWRIESAEGPGLRVAAVGELGDAPMIPAPLLRAETGMRIRVTLHNRLDAPLHVTGLFDRPEVGELPHRTVPARGSLEVEFDAGPPGTYLYSMWEGESPVGREGVITEREQMAGALVIDPVGGGSEDRILVINIFSEPVAPSIHPVEYLEGLAINGRSWPYTELLEMQVGRTERWRVVNASLRNHPMHLHGFYFDVKSRGGFGVDEIYSPEDEREVVTEMMLGSSTMVLDFTPTRPGRWIFHCHLTFHVSNHIRLPGAREADPEHAGAHMAGLVMGIEVAPGPSDLIARGDPVPVDLFVKRFGDEEGRRFGFAFEGAPPRDDEADTPGPLLIFNQYQPADVTVHNGLDQPTGVHWHGLELDAWADGVPNWTASDGRVSPAIQPGDAFTYRLSMMRPGTFMYHTHLNDLEQLTGGLYGPLIVLPPEESFDPAHDHPRIFAWRTTDPAALADVELNGGNRIEDAGTTVGETHRFRIMNIAPAGMISAWVLKEGEPLPFRLLAKDGSDLPPSQQVQVSELPRLAVGETADFLWTPTEPGEYLILIGFEPNEEESIPQRWMVRAGNGDAAPGG